jgi:Mrp family chromosome partitioning ATPase
MGTHVYLDEKSFLAVPLEARKTRQGYRVKAGDLTYYVWAATPLMAMGLVARHANLMTVKSYRHEEVKHHETVEIEPKLLAIVAALTESQKMRLRAMLKQGFRDG